MTEASHNIPKRVSRVKPVLMAALLAGETLNDAAARAGIHRVTAWKLMKSPKFQARYAQLEQERENALEAQIDAQAKTFVDTLTEVAADKNQQGHARVQAADRGLFHRSRLKELKQSRIELEALRSEVGELKELIRNRRAGSDFQHGHLHEVVDANPLWQEAEAVPPGNPIETPKPEGEIQ